MNEAEVESFRMMLAQVDALHSEMSSSSKKAPDKALSPFKVKLVNQVLQNARAILAASSPQLDFLTFDTDDLPTASDVSLVVTQFVECAEKVRCENITKSYQEGIWYWLINTRESAIVTTAPRGCK